MPRTSAATRLPARLAAAGGVAWAVDVAVITANDGAFGIADNVLFLLGLAALVAAVIAAGLRVGRARGPVAGVGVVVVLLLAATAVSAGAEALSHAVYHGGNAGLHGEAGIAAIAVAALACATLAAGPRARRTLAPA